MEEQKEDNSPDNIKVSLMSMLRWMALLELIVGSAGLIIFIAFVQPEQSLLPTITLLLTGLKWVLFISILLYGLSYLDPSANNMKTIFIAPIQKVLRYSITGALLYGLAEIILNVATTTMANGAFIANVFTGVVSTLSIMAILYTVYLLVGAEKPKPE